MGSENAAIEYESFATLVSWTTLTDAGDHQKFVSNAEVWSAQEGQTPLIRPNGLIMGGKISPELTLDKVSVAAAKVYQRGFLVNVLGGSMTVSRAQTGTHRITSIVVNSSGSFEAIAGAEGTAFTEDRGADGGPPWIPTGAVEIGQVRTSSKTAALINADEIMQGINVHCERFDFPVWDTIYMKAENGVLENAGVKFMASLPMIHSDDDGTTVKPKEVWAQYYEPECVTIPKATGFAAADLSYNVSSTQIYGTVISSISSSRGQVTFTVYLEDGISDAFLKCKDKTILVRFIPDRSQPQKAIMTIGKLGVKRTWPANGETVAQCTLSPIMDSVEVYG